MASAVVQLEQLMTPHAGEKREIPTMMPSLASSGLSGDTNPFEFAQTLFQDGDQFMLPNVENVRPPFKCADLCGR
jgi:hypothetical protein